MTTIIKEGETLKVGRDFVDAISGQQCSHGKIGTANRFQPMQWVSTLPIVATEHALRVAARQDGVAVVYFESQAC